MPDDGSGPGEGAGSAADAGADRFRGGPGLDLISYAARTAPVIATLNGVADDGEAGERDDVGGDVEGIEGGAGADLLTGRDGPQRIDGGPGGDVIDPGRGLDDVRAGPGDDTVRALDGTSEWIHCGDGRDTMSGDFDDLPVRCERTTLSAAPPGADRRKPKVKLDSLPRRPRYAHVRRGLRPRVSADEPVSYVIELLAVARSAHITAAPYNLVLVRKTLKRTSRPRRVTLRPKIALARPAAQAARPDPGYGEGRCGQCPEGATDDQGAQVTEADARAIATRWIERDPDTADRERDARTEELVGVLRGLPELAPWVIAAYGEDLPALMGLAHERLYICARDPEDDRAFATTAHPPADVEVARRDIVGDEPARDWLFATPRGDLRVTNDDDAPGRQLAATFGLELPAP